MDPNPALQRAYDAASGAALIAHLPAAGHVLARGGDRLDLLHRLATNRVADLTEGSWRFTILTNPLGRIVDRIQVMEQSNQAHLVTSPGRSQAVKDWLQGYIFFQDNVQLSIGPEWEKRIVILGPEARDHLVDALPAVPELAPGQFAALDGGLVVAIEQPRAGFEIHTSDSSLPLSPEALGLGYDLPAAAQAFEALRIQQGIPAAGSEINEDVIPLEIGLQAEIDFAKGCYIGQEVIARMESRGQLAKRLVGLRLPQELKPGHELVSDGMRAGRVTSIARAPDHGWIGLGLLSRRALDGSHGTLRLDDPGIEIEWRDLPHHTTVGAGGPP